MRVVVVTFGCLLCLLALVAAATVSPSPAGKAPNDPPTGNDAALARLLDEVHQLRVALERTSVANNRFQVAIERMRIQQAHMESIQRELGGVRSEISNLESSKESVNDRLQGFEERSGQLAGSEYEELQAEVKRVKQAAAAIDRDLQTRRNREMELTSRLRQEETRLHEMDRELDALAEDAKGPAPTH